MILEQKNTYDRSIFRHEEWIFDRSVRNMQDFMDVIHLLESNGYELKNCSLVLDHDHSDAFPSDYTYDFDDLNSLLSTIKSWGWDKMERWDWANVTIIYDRPEGSGYVNIYLDTRRAVIYY